MLRKIMFKCAVLGAMALVLPACHLFSDVGSRYEDNIVIGYEPDYYAEWDTFLAEFFNGGVDTVSVCEHFSVGPVTHYAEMELDRSLKGGFALCMGKDPVAAPDHKMSRLAVYGEGGYDDSRVYAVFHDTLSSYMPDHAIGLYVANEESGCFAYGVYVQNVQAVAQAVKYGTGLADGPFTEEDYLTLTFSGSRKGTATGSKTVKLVDGTSLLKGWTEVDLSSLGSVDAIDLHLESSRPDLPLYCCLDNLYIHYLEIY